jgi:hypothetical protein
MTKKTVDEWIKDRPRTPEEYAAFKEARDEAKRDAILAYVEGKTITGTFFYYHSKSCDLDIILDDGSRLHIWSDGELKIQLVKPE